MCPYWQVEEERELIDMVEQGKTLEELARHFKRSPEAIRMKIRRLGLDLREQNKSYYKHNNACMHGAHNASGRVAES
jgi:hypothetical protein